MTLVMKIGMARAGPVGSAVAGQCPDFLWADSQVVALGGKKGLFCQ